NFNKQFGRSGIVKEIKKDDDSAEVDHYFKYQLKLTTSILMGMLVLGILVVLISIEYYILFLIGGMASGIFAFIEHSTEFQAYNLLLKAQKSIDSENQPKDKASFEKSILKLKKLSLILLIPVVGNIIYAILGPREMNKTYLSINSQDKNRTDETQLLNKDN
ncbi:MAG: hypothetical protein ACFFCS_17830, partial [Candidatus Hodarchaeota archaeon]